MLQRNKSAVKICKDIVEEQYKICTFMELFNTLKNFIKKIEEVDRKSKILSSQKYNSSNPFVFKKSKTYVWVDKTEGTEDQCNKKHD